MAPPGEPRHACPPRPTTADSRMPNLRGGMRVLLALFVAASSLGAQPYVAPRPRLVVLVTIDQFRADYLERFGSQLTGGLARLTRGGAWFTNAHQDHAITETAPGHATLLSGRFPRSTGIMMNEIGVEDSSARLLAGAIGSGASPHRFNGTTLVDWLHASDRRSRALSVSMKERAAILPVGRSKAEVYWYSPNGRFTTSRYYRDTLPDWVNAFNARDLPRRSAGRIWSLLLPDSAYHERDSVSIEGAGRDFIFPHRVSDDSLEPASLIRLSPFIDELTLAFALDGVESLGLGRGPQADVLAISLSGTDVIGHRFGPDSREIHDQVLRVDRMLGTFLDSLYRLRDSTSVIVVLAADHGVGTIPELATSTQPIPERVDLREVYDSLRTSLIAAKVNPAAIDIEPPIVLADRTALRNAGVNADSALKALASTLRRQMGVRRVDSFRALLADTLRDPIARRWSHQFPASAGIELIITLTPFSTWGGNVASHGSPYDYDSHVPLVFYGTGITPGRHAEFVRMVDLAPTLATLLGVTPLEPLDGVTLRAALR
jgi:predicted AlkP superfamily pyrophosphatase or phosphodiesterase